MPTIDQLIKQAKAGIKSTPSAPADNTRYGEMSGVKTKSIPKIASDLIVNTAKKRYSQLTTDGPDSVFPDPKKYPQEALERGLNWAYAMAGDMSRVGAKTLSGVVTRQGRNVSDVPATVAKRQSRVPAKGSTQLKLNSPNTVPLPPAVKSARDYINMAKSMAQVREEFAIDDIIKGMSSRGEKFIGTINAYPEIPIGSKFSKNIGTGGQNEGQGFYSTSFGSDTPSYYSFWNQRDNGSNVLGENLILSNGDFNIGGTGKGAAPLESVAKLLKEAGIPYTSKLDKLNLLRNAMKSTMPYQWSETLSPLHVLRKAKDNAPIDQAKMRVHNWSDFANQIRTGGSDQTFESVGLDNGEMSDMLNSEYGSNAVFKSFIDNSAKREIDDMVYRGVLPDGMPESLTDALRRLVSKATKLYKKDIRRSTTLAREALKIETSLHNKAYGASESGLVSKNNAIFNSRFDNINYVTDPNNTFPISRVDGMIDPNKFADTSIFSAGSAYRDKLNNLLNGNGKYPAAYNMSAENTPATINGYGGYPHILSSSIIDKLKRTDRYVTGKEAVMHSIKNLMSLYGE